ncbi:hypothetical protein Syun_023412 [Stephania yunnanensis]|uniref:Uncharacterized protein n=1 Tax=Stephania yunnanensis TaxID=152371 RepID=A0AAP0I3B8_9MAGN
MSVRDFAILMADALSVIPTVVLRNLSDKLYKKRKNVVQEIEEIVKQLAMAGDHDKITAMINLLANEFTSSPQANHRKVHAVLHYGQLDQSISLLFLWKAQKFERIMKGIQGDLIVASTLHIVIGFSGLWRNVIR